MPEAVRHAYAVVVTVNENNAVYAFRLPASGRPLFTEIKNDGRSRIKETPVDAAALLPDGPYDLWSEDEDARFVKDLAGAFARYPRLPKVLTPKVLLDTVLQGVQRRQQQVPAIRPAPDHPGLQHLRPSPYDAVQNPHLCRCRGGHRRSRIHRSSLCSGDSTPISAWMGTPKGPS